MDTDKKTQTLQTNTFAGGMNTDVADSLLKPSEYRLARNLRYVTDTEESTGEMRLVEDYDTLFLVTGEIIATKSIRNYGVIITKNVETISNELGTYWRIYRYDSTQSVSSGTNPNPKLIFGPCPDELGDELSIVCRWESDNNVKVYIADGEEIMCINIADPEYNIVDYTPATGRSYLSTLYSIILPKPQLSLNDTNGLLKSPKIQYAYKLYRYGMSETNISPFSEILRIYKTYNSEKNGYEQNEIVTKSVNIIIPQILDIGNIDSCKVYRISYISEGILPVVDLIYDDSYSGNSIEILDTGLSLGEGTIEELLSEDTVLVKAKLIESKNDYLFAANIQYELDSFDEEIDKYFNKNDINCTLTSKLYELTVANEEIEINQNGFNYGPSLHTGELYRYGILFYDKNGKRSSVKHIKDIRIPYKPSEDPEDDNYIQNYQAPFVNENYNFVLCKIGINFDVSGISQNIKDICSGYEIVRCIRNFEQSETIAQGILGLTLYPESNAGREDKLQASPYLTMKGFTMHGTYHNENVTFSGNTISTRKLLSFSCPEYVYFKDEFSDRIKHYNTLLYIQPYADYVPPIKHDSSGASGGGYAISYKNSMYSAPFVDDWGITVGVPRSAALLLTATGAMSYGWCPLFANSYNVSSGWLAVCKIMPHAYESINDTPCYYNKSYYNINNKYKIKSSAIEFANSPIHSSFSNITTNLSFSKDTYNIDGITFINWCSDNDLYNNTITNGSYDSNPWKLAMVGTCNYEFSSLSSGGKNILFSIDTETEDSTYQTTISSPVVSSSGPYGNLLSEIKQSFIISIFNLRKIVIQNPYGDYNSSVYYSYGNYSDSFTSIDVYDGDTFNSVFVFNSAHSCASLSYTPQGYPTLYVVPIESSIDLKSTIGDLHKNNITSIGWSNFQDEVSKCRGFEQNSPAYVYNTAYYSDIKYPQFFSTTYADVYSKNYDTRVINSLKKENNEKIDSWSKFKAVNYLDVDSRYGQITDMRLFKNQLLFWLESATGILSSNEQLLILNPNGANLTLGTGDVLLRFDYITTVYGMKAGLFAEEQSNSYIYWWDDNKRKILQYGNGFSVLSDIKNVSNFINTGTSIEKPSIYYNKKYQEIWFSIISKPYIKYYTNPERFEFPKSSEQENTILLFDYPLIYNENLQVFTGVYDTIFRNKLYFDDGDLLTRSYYVNSVVNNETPLLKPYLKYVVSASSGITKTYDSQEIGGRFYENSSIVDIDSTTSVENKQNSLDLNNKYHSSNLSPLKFRFTTPLNQLAISSGSNISIREYNLKMDIPRNGGSALYGNRMRGKTMQCELLSTSASKDFALQYITTKFRISCS